MIEASSHGVGRREPVTDQQHGPGERRRVTVASPHAAGRRSAGAALLVVAALGLVAIVALVAASRPLHHTTRHGTASVASTAGRIGLVAGPVALLSALAVVIGVRRSRAPKGAAPRRTTMLLGAALATAATGIAALGAATTVPLVAQATPVRSASTGPAYDPLLRRVRGRLDPASGDTVIDLDLDGTGRFLDRQQACPGGRFQPIAGPGSTALVPVDANCDGTVDFYAELPPTTVAPGGTSTTAPPAVAPTPKRSDHRALVSAALVAAGAALAACLFVLGRRRDRHVLVVDPMAPLGAPEPVVDRGEVARTISRSIDAMVADPDPRTAIIGAYAGLLRGLSDAGLPRRPQEAPEEHLGRCLGELDVAPAPLRRLTTLFAEARFSPHPLDEHHRDDAIAALREALDELPSVPVGAAP